MFICPVFCSDSAVYEYRVQFPSQFVSLRHDVTTCSFFNCFCLCFRQSIVAAGPNYSYLLTGHPFQSWSLGFFQGSCLPDLCLWTVLWPQSRTFLFKSAFVLLSLTVDMFTLNMTGLFLISLALFISFISILLLTHTIICFHIRSYYQTFVPRQPPSLIKYCGPFCCICHCLLPKHILNVHLLLGNSTNLRPAPSIPGHFVYLLLLIEVIHDKVFF